MTSQHATAQVKEAALRLGFDAVAIASAEPLFDPIARYEQWLQQGNHGMMQWMERKVDERRDVTHLLPGARSVIVVARNYYTPTVNDPESIGKISRYAWGDDYHDVITPMLDELSRAIETIVPGSATRRYVDTGPVMEKEWAVRSGLAWQGKHSNVLRRDIGSWFFLGVVITTAELEAGVPMMDYCGTCTACIDACPTKAITQPYVVDSRKCLSYWTIEVKPEHPVPEAISSKMDGWLYGCDVCQDVCPWNRFQTPTDEPRFQPRDQITKMNPADVLDLRPDSFAERFRGSPIKRAKLAGLQRSARALLSTLPTNESHGEQNE